MEFAKYIENALPDTDRTPVDTVIEFVKAYNKWAKECHRLVKSDRAYLVELTRDDSLARKILQEIYKKYCTPKNRQYHRASKGYFFYGGTYNSSEEVERCTEVTTTKVEVQTRKIKNVSTAKKYTVFRQGEVWKIDAVESLAESNQWIFDIL
jgi:hypothetical protein